MAVSMDSILKLSTPKKVLILAVLLCLIAGAYVYLLFLPRQAELASLTSECDKLTRELNESRSISRELQKYRGQIGTLNTELANALTQLPNEKEIPEILKNISTLGKESTLEFTLFRPKPEEPQPFYAKVPIDLIVIGSYHNTGLFFDKVSKLPRIINVVDFSMSRAKDVKGRSENEISVKTSCLVNTYRFIEKKSEDKKSEGKTEKPKGQPEEEDKLGGGKKK